MRDAAPVKRRTQSPSSTYLRVVALLLALAGSISAARAENPTIRELRALMEENLAACTNEDLPALMKTMSAEMPQRELFMEQCRKEWAECDIYHRLEDIKVVQQTEWKPPYLVATVTETQREVSPDGDNPERENGPDDVSNFMAIRTRHSVTECDVLFKRERGKWKVVAGLTEPRPVEVKTP